jgi:hypothetical protein
MRQPAGFNRTAIAGTIVISAIVAFCGFGIVRAERAKPARSKTFACSTGTACVEGNASASATNGVYGSASGSHVHGVYGTNRSGTAVTGTTSSTNGGSGVSGVSTAGSGSASGVYGRSSSENGFGIVGNSTSANGIVGVTTADGLAGIYADEKGAGTGLVGTTNDESGRYFVISVQGDNSQTMLFEAYNMGTGGDCFISALAAMTCSGGVSGSVLHARHRNRAGQRVVSYASESASATIEDDGTAKISGGVATVRIDARFAALMDRAWYYVFITPLGDTRGLYVSAKTPLGFVVREAEHGRDTLAFDYRIVAHPRDRTRDRLPPAPEVRMHPKPPSVHAEALDLRQ